ncbi:hypothetical protein [Streptomyces luteocolor]|uniref:hypothetical protein n=1 Tax=Streptomyces luteocolor TaxID=285500 RepID=UPI000853974F|nr:hypothetical protein [Streptomyces luteocolor]
MPTVTVTASDGPVTVEATEPVPGLRLYELPAEPSLEYRWVLAHHEGRTLGLFTSADDASGAAAAVAAMADWTRGAMTVANEISLGGNAERLGFTLIAHGCAPTSK